MVMNQTKKEVSGQFEYLGRWIDKKHFRAFVYDTNRNDKLANSHDEYESLLSSGLWFPTRELAEKTLLSAKSKESEKNNKNEKSDQSDLGRKKIKHL